MTGLERRYRLLLRLYPAAFRDRHGEDLVVTALDAAPPGRHWPTASDTVDLVASAVRHRAARTGLDRALALAGPVALAFTAGLSLFYLAASERMFRRIEPLSFVHYRLWGDGLPPAPTETFLAVFSSTAALAYLAWLVAALGYATLPRRGSAVLTGLALGLTLVLTVSAALSTRLGDPWPLPGLILLSTLGVIALPGARPPGSRTDRIWAWAGPAVAFAGTVLFGVPVWIAPTPVTDENELTGEIWHGLSYRSGPSWSQILSSPTDIDRLTLALLMLLLLTATALRLAAKGRQVGAWITLFVTAPAGWTLATSVFYLENSALQPAACWLLWCLPLTVAVGWLTRRRGRDDLRLPAA